ncbi:MAG: hypothetical protein JNM24_17960 [Bdellovibrionaceae bacterium]|nr:hypothetical protein [Pseudobdellovibrionaceae bacterium]
MVPLSDLSALSKQINEATEEANQTLRDFETKLLSFNIGVPANALISRIDVPLAYAQGLFPGRPLPTTGPCYDEMWLGWQKLNGKWQIVVTNRLCQKAVASGALDELLFEEVRSINNLSREARIKVLSNLEKLVEALKTSGEKLLGVFSKAKELTATI